MEDRPMWVENVAMPIFRIRITNSEFNDCSDSEFTDENSARAQALKAALAIGAEEICRGSCFFAAEASIEKDGDRLGRFMVSIGTSPLR